MCVEDGISGLRKWVFSKEPILLILIFYYYSFLISNIVVIIKQFTPEYSKFINSLNDALPQISRKSHENDAFVSSSAKNLSDLIKKIQLENKQINSPEAPTILNQVVTSNIPNTITSTPGVSSSPPSSSLTSLDSFSFDHTIIRYLPTCVLVRLPYNRMETSAFHDEEEVTVVDNDLLIKNTTANIALVSQPVSNALPTLKRSSGKFSSSRRSVSWDEQNLNELKAEKQRMIAAGLMYDSAFENHALQEHLIEQSIFGFTPSQNLTVPPSFLPSLSSSSTPVLTPLPSVVSVRTFSRPAPIPTDMLHVPVNLEEANKMMIEKQVVNVIGPAKKKVTTVYSCSMTPFYYTMEEYVSSTIAVCIYKSSFFFF
jgi:hypothetical protein